MGKNLPKRKPARLKEYDYSTPGAYFVTVCTYKKQCLLSNIVGGGHGNPPLQNIIGQLKSYTTNKFYNTLWQRSYHDHIIRGESDYNKIWEYIDTNQIKWESDCFYEKRNSNFKLFLFHYISFLS